MVDVLGHEPLELSLVPDDAPVEQLATQGADPTLGDAVGHRRAHRGLEDLDAFGAEHLVERAGELGAPVTHQRPGVRELLAVDEEQVAGGLDRR